MHLCLEMQWSCYSSQKTGTSLEDFRLVLGRVEPRAHYRWDCSVRWRPKFCICHWGGRGQWERVYWRTYLINKIQIREWIKRGLEVINSIQQISFFQSIASGFLSTRWILMNEGDINSKREGMSRFSSHSFILSSFAALNVYKRAILEGYRLS